MLLSLNGCQVLKKRFSFLSKTTSQPNVQIDLGVAVFRHAETQPSISYSWLMPENKQYVLGYLLQPQEANSTALFYESFAKSVGFRRTGAKSFAWTPPPQCPKDMQCIYDALIEHSRAAIVPLANRFLTRARELRIGTLEMASLILSFVQNIPYAEPPDPFGLRPPELVVSQQSGDCDSKALLLHLLLDAVGIESIVISSHMHAHVMAAIALPTQGKTFVWRGRRYSFAETTSMGSPIGFINPHLLTPNDWRPAFVPRKTHQIL